MAQTPWFHLSLWNLWHLALSLCSFRHPLHAQFPCISTAAACWDNPTMMRTMLNSSETASLLRSAARSTENLMFQLGEVCNGNQHLLVEWGNSHLAVLFASFPFPFPYFCPYLAGSLSQPPLAAQPVNDGPSSSSEPWVDACLCDSCGVLSKTKAAWQAAALRLDQTGLVYWSAPLCSVLLRICVWLRVDWVLLVTAWKWEPFGPHTRGV